MLLSEKDKLERTIRMLEFLQKQETESGDYDYAQILEHAIEILKDLPPASKISPEENKSSKVYHNKTYLKIEGPLKVYLISENDLNDIHSFLWTTIKELYDHEVKKAICGLERLVTNIGERLGDSDEEI